jgi:hypothetical protein
VKRTVLNDDDVPGDGAPPRRLRATPILDHLKRDENIGP